MDETDAMMNARASLGLKLALGAVAMAGVGYQVSLVRLLSVVLWYHFAFLVVSTAVLGFGLSGMWMVMRPALADREGLEERLAKLGAALTASIVAGYGVIALVPFDPFRMGVEPVQILWGLVYVMAMMVPFFLNGLFVGITLVAFAREAGRLYAYDLVGAGSAALVTLASFSLIGGEQTLLFSSVFAAAAALFARRKSRFTAGALVLSFGATLLLADALPLRVTEDKVISDSSISEVLGDERRLETRWNALSRIDVVAFDKGRRDILIDAGVALTRLPRVRKNIDEIPPSKDFLALGFTVHREPSVLVLGSGGGWEVANALTYDASRVTAVELNPAISDLVRTTQAEWTGRIFEHEDVELVTDEARAYLNQSDQKWDVIISAHTISNAATSSGSMNLAESHTLTVEAFEAYYEHLTPDGLLYLTRPESQLPKLVATAATVLRTQGHDPEPRITAFRFRDKRHGESFTAGMIVAMDPKALQSINRSMREHQAEPLWAPDLGARDARFSRALQLDHGFRLATDERPFFNFNRGWTNLGLDDVRRVFGAGDSGRLALEGEPVSEVSLLVLLILVFVFSAVATGVPLYLRRDALPSDSGTGLTVALYFAALGVGYMYAELGLVHRLGVFLGSPTVTFGVVIAGMLLCSGAGAAVSQRFDLAKSVKVVAAAALVLGAVALLSGWIVPWALGLGTGLRILVAILTVAPVGFALGMAFPLGMRVLDELDPGYLPLAWGINGFASVLGSATSIIVATGLGFTWLLGLGACIYVFAAIAMSKLIVARNGDSS